MDIKVNMAVMANQSESIRSLCQKHREGYEGVYDYFKKLMGDLELEEATGHAVKEYLTLVLLPLCKGAMLLMDATIEANGRFLEEYLERVDQCDLSSVDLEVEIRQCEELISETQQTVRELAVSSLPPLKKAQQISKNTALLGIYGSLKRELRYKLEQLKIFSEHSPLFFEEADYLKTLLEQGYLQAENCWDEKGELLDKMADFDGDWAVQLQRLAQAHQDT